MTDKSNDHANKPQTDAIPDLAPIKDDENVKGGWGAAKIPSPSGPIPVPYPNLPK